MKRLAIGLGLAVGCGGARAPSSVPEAPVDRVTHDPDGVTVHRDGACRPWQETVEREHAIAETNALAVTRALAEANLRATDAAIGPPDYFPARADEPIGWQVVDASGRRSLLSPPTYRSCGSVPFTLALDGRGGVVVLMMQQRRVAHHELSVCGCEVDVPITCGGAAPELIHWRWTLPSTLTFAGPQSLVVDLETSQRVFAGRADGAPCPMPTAPP